MIPLSTLLLLLLGLFPSMGSAAEESGAPKRGVPILVYHRFGPHVSDSMTVTGSLFEAHLKYLRDSGYQVIALRELVYRYFEQGEHLPNSRMVAITADDGHVSVYTDAFPLIRKYQTPVTLFIYPSAISNASYAMTWDQLRGLKASGLFYFGSHTYWHPNFKKDRERLKPADYEKSVETQLKKSREVLEKQLNQKVDLLAWPFGIHDAWLGAKAIKAGYAAAFTIERFPASPGENRMALPRYLMTQADRGKAFERIVNGFHSSGN
jgi:peptidoglycan/xylan/chitin deacetylase (PgdA/CDA1 family)